MTPAYTIAIEDRDIPARTIILALCFSSTRRYNNNELHIKASFTHERDCGIDDIYDHNGELLAISPQVRDQLLFILDNKYGLNDWLHDYLHDTDREEGKIYRSNHPHDTDKERYDE